MILTIYVSPFIFLHERRILVILGGTNPMIAIISRVIDVDSLQSLLANRFPAKWTNRHDAAMRLFIAWIASTAIALLVLTRLAQTIDVIVR